MKTNTRFTQMISKIGIVVVMGATVLLITRCAGEDEVNPLTPSGNPGTAAVSTDGDWSLDKVHSAINWETRYYGEQSFLTGKFNSFNIFIDFDQADLENSWIKSWVKLSTCNTGEPGRDGLGHCMNGYLGVEHNGDTLANGDPDPAGIIGDSDTAWFNSTTIEEFGNGYRAKGTLDFRGQTSDVMLYFTYIEEKDYSDPPDGSRIRTSFNGELEFNPKSNHGVTSGSIGDMMTVKVNAIYRK